MTDASIVAERIDTFEALDPLAARVHGLLAPRLAAGRVGAMLHGHWFGHPVHPVLTDLSIGFWTSAWLLDVFGGERSAPAADAFVALGVVSAAPTAITGWADWVLLPDRRRRSGLVHAAANLTATGLYTASLLARRSGRRRAGIALGHLGAAAATAGAYLGGHLTFGHSASDRELLRTPGDERLRTW